MKPDSVGPKIGASMWFCLLFNKIFGAFTKLFKFGKRFITDVTSILSKRRLILLVRFEIAEECGAFMHRISAFHKLVNCRKETPYIAVSDRNYPIYG